MFKRFLCWIGFHRRRDIIGDSSNPFAHNAPLWHVTECCRCGKAMMTCYTWAGDLEYVHPNKEAAIAAAKIGHPHPEHLESEA